MLKFISYNDKNNEKKIQEELGLNTNLLDFFSSTEPKEITEKINSTLNEIKSNIKREEAFYTKLIYYFSYIINSKSFKPNEEKSIKCIKNLIEICKEKKYIQIYQDLFNLFDESQKEFKKIILNEIFTSNYPFSEEDFLSLYILFILYIKLHFDIEVIEHLSELVSKNKNFYLLRKIENSEKILTALRHNLSKNKNFIKININISKLYFFLALSSPDLVDEDLEKLELNEKLVEEKKLIDALNDRKDEEILFNKDNKKYLDDVYGEKSSEIVLNSAKETCIHEVLIGFEDDKQNVVSFKDFIGDILNDDDENEKNELKDEEVQEKFEEIEDMLISGKEHLLYNVIVDYLKKEIKILYIRRPNYEKEQKVNLLNKVKNIKNKLEMILKAINKI